MNYFGIKNSYPKKILLERGRFRIVKKDVSRLAYDCRRHIDLLERLDGPKGDLSDTLYVKVNRFYGQKPTGEILSRIEEVIRLYEKIKNGEDRTPIVVTSNGARLDGSHRAGALLFLRIKEADAKEVYAPRVFVWIVGREAARKRMVYDKYRGKAVYVKGRRLGTVLYTDYVRWDPFSIMGTYYHVLDTGEIVNMKRCNIV